MLILIAVAVLAVELLSRRHALSFWLDTLKIGVTLPRWQRC